MIHQFIQNGHHIVLDINSGSVHVVDNIAYDMIAVYKEKSKEDTVKYILEKYPADITPEEAEELYADIGHLENSGKLFSESEFHPSAEAYDPDKQVIKAMCLHVAHTCNLTCDYCFARQGCFNGKEAIMDYSVAKQAIDFLIEHSGSRKNLEVDFFGGEPLLNMDMIKRLVSYCRGLEEKHNKKFRFTLTTNGVLLDDDITEFANREMDNVVLSLDGRKDVHDRLRRLGNGQGSYDIIVPKFKKFISARGTKSYYIRGTFTHFNMDFTQDIRHMLDLGFNELSMEPVVCSPDDPYALKTGDLPYLYSQYEELAQLMLERETAGEPFSFYHYNLDLHHGPCIYKRLKGCGSGTEYVAVTPLGDLYPCHQFVGDSKYLLGNVWDGIGRQDICESFSHCNVFENESCKSCWAKLYCSGGCAANAYHSTGSIDGIYEFGCDLFKKRIECAIMLQAARHSK